MKLMRVELAVGDSTQWATLSIFLIIGRADSLLTVFHSVYQTTRLRRVRLVELVCTKGPLDLV